MSRVLCFLLTRRPASSTLFPYTTLFRSRQSVVSELAAVGAVDGNLAVHPVHRAVDRGGISDHALAGGLSRSEEHTSELQSRVDLVCRLLLEKKKTYSHL